MASEMGVEPSFSTSDASNVELIMKATPRNSTIGTSQRGAEVKANYPSDAPRDRREVADPVISTIGARCGAEVGINSRKDPERGSKIGTEPRNSTKTLSSQIHASFEHFAPQCTSSTSSTRPVFPAVCTILLDLLTTLCHVVGNLFCVRLISYFKMSPNAIHKGSSCSVGITVVRYGLLVHSIT